MEQKKVIEIYDKILDNYISKITPPLIQIWDSERKVYGYIFNKLKRFYFFTAYISDKHIAVQGNDRILLSLYTKCCLDLYSIFHCLYNGLEVQATVIFRSLFESFINVELILRENPRERIKLFAEFEHVQRWNHILSHRKLNEKGIEDELDLPKQDMVVYENNYNKVKDNYNLTKPHHWAWKIFKEELKNQNPSLKKICEYLGPEFEKDYVQAYGTDSMIAHGSPILGNYYTTKDTNVTVNSPKFTYSVNSLVY